jgi:hypothetical protein
LYRLRHRSASAWYAAVPSISSICYFGSHDRSALAAGHGLSGSRDSGSSGGRYDAATPTCSGAPSTGCAASGVATRATSRRLHASSSNMRACRREIPLLRPAHRRRSLWGRLHHLVAVWKIATACSICHSPCAHLYRQLSKKRKNSLLDGVDLGPGRTTTLCQQLVIRR